MSDEVKDVWAQLEMEIRKEIEAKEKGIAEAEILDWEQGTLGDYYPEEVLQKWNRNPEIEVIQIRYRTEWGVEMSEIFTLSTHPRSNLRKFYARYGKPEPGQKVILKYDPEKDRWKILI